MLSWKFPVGPPKTPPSQERRPYERSIEGYNGGFIITCKPYSWGCGFEGCTLDTMMLNLFNCLLQCKHLSKLVLFWPRECHWWLWNVFWRQGETTTTTNKSGIHSHRKCLNSLLHQTHPGGAEDNDDEGKPADGSAGDSILRDSWHRIQCIFMEADRNLKAQNCSICKKNCSIWDKHETLKGIIKIHFCCGGQACHRQLWSWQRVRPPSWFPAGTACVGKWQAKLLLEEQFLEKFLD